MRCSGIATAVSAILFGIAGEHASAFNLPNSRFLVPFSGVGSMIRRIPTYSTDRVQPFTPLRLRKRAGQRGHTIFSMADNKVSNNMMVLNPPVLNECNFHRSMSWKERSRYFPFGALQFQMLSYHFANCQIIFDQIKFESGFTKREFLVTSDDMYPQDIKFELLKDKCSLLDAYQVGDGVKVSFNIRGSTWQGKYFTNLQVLFVSPAERLVSNKTELFQAWRIERLAPVLDNIGNMPEWGMLPQTALKPPTAPPPAQPPQPPYNAAAPPSWQGGFAAPAAAPPAWQSGPPAWQSGAAPAAPAWQGAAVGGPNGAPPAAAAPIPNWQGGATTATVPAAPAWQGDGGSAAGSSLSWDDDIPF
jgi:hypothetical protein